MQSADSKQKIRLCEDIHGNVYDVRRIPPGTVFENLDLSDMDFTELPKVLSTCTVKGWFKCCRTDISSLKNSPKVEGTIDVSGCKNFRSFYGLRKGAQWIYCAHCPSLNSLEGCYGGVRIVNCQDSAIKYIPDYISDRAIFGMFRKDIAGCRANWHAKQAIARAVEQWTRYGEAVERADNFEYYFIDDFQNTTAR